MGTKLRDPALRRIRALAIIERRIKTSMSLKEIGQEFGVEATTISDEINWAKRQNLVANYEDQILENLVPKALDAFRKALESGDAQVALEVLKGTGLLKKPSDKPLINPAPQEDSLEIHIKRIRGDNGRSNPSRPALETNRPSDSHPSRVVEGALVSVTEIAAPAVCPSSDEDHQTHPEPSLDGTVVVEGLQPKPSNS